MRDGTECKLFIGCYCSLKNFQGGGGNWVVNLPLVTLACQVLDTVVAFSVETSGVVLHFPVLFSNLNLPGLPQL